MRRELHGAPHGGHGLVVPPQPAIGRAQVVVELGIVAADRDRALDQLGRFGVSARLQAHDPQQVPGLGALGVLRENLPIELFGQRNITRPMMLESGAQRVGGGLRHGRKNRCTGKHAGKSGQKQNEAGGPLP